MALQILSFTDLWLDDAPSTVTLRLKAGTLVYGALYGVTEGGRCQPGEVLLQPTPNEQPLHYTMHQIDRIYAGRVD